MRYLVKKIPSTSLVQYDGSRYYCEIAGGTAEKSTVDTTGLLAGSKYLDVQTGTWYVYDELTNAWAVSAEGGSADPAVVEASVEAWLDAHPEATTTVQDGSISYAKLDTTLKGKADAVATLSDEIVSLDGRVDLLEKIETAREFTPAQLQEIAASGLAAEYFSIGDIIYIDWVDKKPTPSVTYKVPHVVVHIGDVYDANNVKHEGALWLMWMYATPQAMPFDAAEAIVETESTFQSGYYYYTKNADGSFTEQTVTVGDTIPSGETYYKHVRTGMAGRLRYGSNDWSESAYRQWLNSTGDKGEWWTAQHESDVAPSEAANTPGFLTGYSDDWLAIFKPVKVVTALNTVCDEGRDVVTYDKFFLPSLEQMYGAPQKAGVEGVYWEYWKEETGYDAPTNGSASNVVDARKISSINAPDGAAVTVRLRSANRSNTPTVWNVNTAGYLSTANASNSYRAQPACVIY